MTTQIKLLMDLAESKGAKCRYTFSYNYEITFKDGSMYDGLYYDCIKALGRKKDEPKFGVRMFTGEFAMQMLGI